MAQRFSGWLASAAGQLQIVLVLAIAVGGGGVGFGLRNLAIQIAALLVLAMNYQRVRRFLGEAPRTVLALVSLTLALPLIQLIPLPPSIWQGLPGRDPAAAALAIARVPADSWMPLSLDRGRTLTAFVGLIAPAAILALGMTFTSEEKADLARCICIAALAALLLGVFQISTANTAAMLFGFTPKPDVLYAVFANRNSTALFFVIALLLLASAPWWRSKQGLLGATAAGALLALGVLLTQSRSGMVLLLVAIGFAGLRAAFAAFARRRGGDGLPRPAWMVALLVAFLVAAAALASAMLGGRAADSIARFGDPETDRPEMWEDASFAAGVYWPAGSGLGTFDEVFQLHESLEYVSPRRAGRAHNDLLEVVIEGGIASAALVLAWLVWCVGAVFRAPPYWRWTAMGAGGGVLLLLLQSLLDYPLRNQALLCVAAVLVALLASKRRRGA